MADPSPLELDFHQKMLGIYTTAKEQCGYNATRFLQMVSNYGSLRTAKQLLATNEPSDGFTVLWGRGRLDLTVENLVLNPKYQTLFSPDEIAVARERLIAYGYQA
jgi:hypothetical protein